MKITALYKIYRGKEFLIPSIQSIYNHVDKIVFASSNIGWDGSKENNCKEIVETFQDPLNKICIVDADTRDQNQQYQIGLTKVGQCDWILLIDSDEVWTDSAWEKAREYLFNCRREVNGFTCSMHSYIKKVIYRIDDTFNTQVRPMVFIRPNVYSGIRGNGVCPWRYMAGVYVHHFALVRENDEEVFRKLRTSAVGDRATLINLDNWKAEVWDKIPGPAYHYQVGCAGVWQKTVEIKPEELPITVRNMK